jgi:hypothetical protein
MTRNEQWLSIQWRAVKAGLFLQKRGTWTVGRQRRLLDAATARFDSGVVR